MNEFYGITIGGIILFILSLDNLIAMSAAYLALLIVTTFYISISKVAKGRKEE